MNKMAYSIWPESIPVSYEVTQPDGTNNFCHLTLASIQDIADVLGDGWDAEEIGSTENVSIQYRKGTTTGMIAVGETLPALVNSTLYPALAFFFNFYNTANPQNFEVNVVNKLTGELITFCCISGINVNIERIDVYSFNSKTKAISGCEALGQNHHAIVFSENGVLLPDRVQANNGTNDLRITRPNGDYANTYYPYTVANSPKFVIEPIFYMYNTDLEFTGLYQDTRDTNVLSKVVTYNGVTYKVFGCPPGRTDQRPKVVVSSEIVG